MQGFKVKTQTKANEYDLFICVRFNGWNEAVNPRIFLFLAGKKMIWFEKF